MLSMMVISFFSRAIDSCSFPLLMKSVPKPGIIPWMQHREGEGKEERDYYLRLYQVSTL